MRGFYISLAVIAIAIVIYYYFFVMNQLFKYPVKAKISSPFGPRIAPKAGASTDHNGIDFAIPTGTTLQAPLDGKILRTWKDTGNGNAMQIVHKNGWITGYSHLSSYNKKTGDIVKQGEVIAFSGATGNVTGPHLHFTLTNPQGIKVDPALYQGKKLA